MQAYNELKENNAYSSESAKVISYDDYQIIAEDESMRKTVKLASLVSRKDIMVMLYGESGTGKDVLSKLIWRLSDRKNKVFFPVNCAAIPNELLESELFGYEKGTFTGALSNGKSGIFEEANGGTLFLDEIGDLPLGMQAKILRVIESGEIRKIGGSNIIKADVRIIAATNKALDKMVMDGTFREDLYYRLNVAPIYIKPLRERPMDIEPLARYFLNMYNNKHKENKKVSDGGIGALCQYTWPGNVRELRNLIERVVVMSGTDNINRSVIKEALLIQEKSMQRYGFNSMISDKSQAAVSLKDAVQEFEKKYIYSVVESYGGNVAKAAEVLGVCRSSLYNKIGKSYSPKMHS